jgi:hypothetical protein
MMSGGTENHDEEARRPNEGCSSTKKTAAPTVIPMMSHTVFKTPFSLYAMALMSRTSPTLIRNLTGLPPGEDGPCPSISLLK